MFNVVIGKASQIGGEMCANPTVRKLSFTGSTEVGRMLMQQVAPTIKKLSLELGGNAPFIVFDDADLDAAAEGAIISKYRNAGQTCVCANRLFVQDKVYDAFAAKLAERVAKLKVGNGTEAGVTQGPLINAGRRRQGRRARRGRDGATARKVALGGKRHALGGNFYEPTVLTDVTPEMKIFSRGNVRTGRAAHPLQGRRGSRASSPTTASSAWPRTSTAATSAAPGASPSSSKPAWSASTPGLITTQVAPFGGVKQSGLGREGSEVRHRRIRRGQVHLLRRHLDPSVVTCDGVARRRAFGAQVLGTGDTPATSARRLVRTARTPSVAQVRRAARSRRSPA